ncbi:MAG: hypothetical protein E7511_05785 [Ruminococcus sp.]|nr:hypothetical protein [Ruminococcus sp.]
MNEQNLIRPEDLTPSERRENASKAGKASAAARRRRRDMKAKMKMILGLPVSDCDNFNTLAVMGIAPEEIDNETLMLVGLFRKAMNGDVQAVREVRNILGKDNDTERLKLQKQQLALQEKKLEGDVAADLPDDGFLEALSGTAAADWSDADET